MKITMRLVSYSLFWVLVLSACNSAGQTAVQTVVYSTSAPDPTQVRSLPTPILPKQVIAYKDLRVAMIQSEVTTDYLTEYGSRRGSTSGSKFLWIEVQLENSGTGEQNLPAPEHFSVVYGTSEFKPGYGHRKDYPDYLALKPNLFQGQKVAAWLRFEIPVAAELPEIQFVFLPESVQINYSFPSNGYTWADHPMYFWRCQR